MKNLVSFFIKVNNFVQRCLLHGVKLSHFFTSKNEMGVLTFELILMENTVLVGLGPFGGSYILAPMNADNFKTCVQRFRFPSFVARWWRKKCALYPVFEWEFWSPERNTNFPQEKNSGNWSERNTGSESLQLNEVPG